MIKAAAYLRISKDEEGKGLGIERQLDAVKALCQVRGWVLDERWLIAENNRSAWDDSKPRPGFQRLLGGMESGEVKAVAVFAFDRLARRRKDVAHVLDLVEKRGVLIAAHSGNLDLSTVYGRGIAGVLGALAGMEIASMQERLNAKAEQNVQAGKVHNGGSRPYGYTLRRNEVVPHEVEILQEISRRLIDGESLTGVARDLNRRGVNASTYVPKPLAPGEEPGTGQEPKTRLWNTKTLREVMARPRLCGRVVHRGEVVPGVTGQWPAILTPVEFDTLQIAISARRVVEHRWTNARMHLLSGTLLRCGTCDSKVLAFKQTSGVGAYRCRGHVLRNEANVDAHVRSAVIQFAMENPVRVSEWQQEQQADLSSQIATLEHRKAEAVRAFARHGGDPASLAMLTADLQAQITALRSQQVEQVVLGSDLEWAQFDVSDVMAAPVTTAEGIEQQRAVLALYVDRITLHPSKQRGRGYDETATEIAYRDPNRRKWTAVVAS